VGGGSFFLGTKATGIVGACRTAARVFFGSRAFRENLTAKLKIKLESGGRQSANGYHGPEIKDH
jgi:hypothetical protein